MRAPLRLACLLLCALPALALADGGDELWMFRGIEDINSFATLPDVDGDGVADVVVATYDAGADGDHTYLLSGGDLGGSPAVIWSARPESGVSNGGGYGDDCLARSPDLSGDGFPDVLIGTAWGNRSVHALDGRTGAVLWTFDTYLESASGWIYSVAPHADRTGDGIPEVICGAGSDNNRGYLLDGADGSVIWRFLGSIDAVVRARSLPDVNGDLVPDVLFCGSDYEDRVFCVSGAGDGVATPIWEHDMGDSNWAATVIDDIDGDAIADLVVGSWDSADQVKALSGATGLLLWQFSNGTYQPTMRLVTLSDVNGDGYRDLAVGSWERAVRVVSGLDGALIWESWAGTTNGGDFWSVDRVDDVTGDGADEVVGGSFDGKVYLFNGATGDTLWMFHTGRRLYSVRGTADLSGNLVPDVLGGTQNLYGDPGGDAYAIEGGSNLTAAGAVWADGEAVLQTTAMGGVALSWTCNRDLPFQVYRAVEDGARAADRRALAEARARGELRIHEVIEAVRAAEEPAWVRVNAAPVTPAAAEGAAWRYALEDAIAATAGEKLHYRLAALLPGGGELPVLDLLARAAAPVPARLLLDAALMPNPFNPATRLRVDLAAAAEVGFLVHDARGRRVATVPPRALPAGAGEIPWTAADDAGRPLPSGLYFVTPLVGAEPGPALRAVLLK